MEKDSNKKMYTFKPFKWVEMNPKGTLNPQGRSGHRVIYFNQAIYAFGGYNPNVTLEENDDELWEINQPMFKELWKFNLDSCRWSKIRLKGEAPTMLASHTAQFMMIAERPKLLVSEFLSKNFVKIVKNHAFISNFRFTAELLFHLDKSCPSKFMFVIYGTIIGKSSRAQINFQKLFTAKLQLFKMRIFTSLEERPV